MSERHLWYVILNPGEVDHLQSALDAALKHSGVYEDVYQKIMHPERFGCLHCEHFGQATVERQQWCWLNDAPCPHMMTCFDFMRKRDEK